MNVESRALNQWHATPIVEVMNRLQTTPAGLEEEEAAWRLSRVGPNRLPPPRPTSAAKILIDQFKSVVIALLAAATGVSIITGDYLDAAAIVFVLAINTLIGFGTEIRARRAMDALLQFDLPLAGVLRGGALRVVPAADLVPGDVIEINAGQSVPADARLLEAADLRMIESALTGESLPVSKASDAMLPAETARGGRAFTTVPSGATMVSASRHPSFVGSSSGSSRRKA